MESKLAQQILPYLQTSSVEESDLFLKILNKFPPESLQQLYIMIIFLTTQERKKVIQLFHDKLKAFQGKKVSGLEKIVKAELELLKV